MNRREYFISCFNLLGDCWCLNRRSDVSHIWRRIGGVFSILIGMFGCNNWLRDNRGFCNGWGFLLYNSVWRIFIFYLFYPRLSCGSYRCRIFVIGLIYGG